MAATIPLQPLPSSVPTILMQNYDVFSRHGDACCVKLEEISGPDVFEEDPSKFEVSVAWSNGFRSAHYDEACLLTAF